MRVLHQVTGCDSCPMCAENAFCQHPLREGNSSIYTGTAINGRDDWAPEWCPLRAGELLISLRVRP